MDGWTHLCCYTRRLKLYGPNWFPNLWFKFSNGANPHRNLTIFLQCVPYNWHTNAAICSLTSIGLLGKLHNLCDFDKGGQFWRRYGVSESLSFGDQKPRFLPIPFSQGSLSHITLITDLQFGWHAISWQGTSAILSSLLLQQRNM